MIVALGTIITGGTVGAYFAIAPIWLVQWGFER